MTKKTQNLTFYWIGSFVLFIGLSSWLFGPVAPVVEFEDLLCNQIYLDSTNSSENSYDQSSYGDCVIEGENFSAGDNLYRFTVSDTDTFTIEFEVLDLSNLHLFVMSNTIDPDTETDCPDTCMFRLDGTMDLETALLPGIYWLSVDGMISDTGMEESEGDYSLAIRCRTYLEEIACGEVIEGTTVNRLSNYGILDYGSCFPTGTDPNDFPYSEAGDVIYRVEQTEKSTLTFILENLDTPDIHLFFLDDIPDPTDGSTFPGGCFASSTSGSGVETITATLDIGIYYLVVDGPGAEGAYRLSMSCQNDYETIACEEVVIASTAARVSYYSSDDYADCTPANTYSGGDLTYLLNIETQDELTLNLNSTDGDNLALVLAEAIYNETTMTYSLGSCMALSDSGITREVIEMTLDSGSYFIIVDGALMPNDTAAEGAFVLQVKCLSFPIELISFTGVPKEEGVQLDWVTASEIGFEGFYLQRSQDGIQWSNLVWQVSKGSPSGKTSYSFMDKQPVSGENFYRLRSIDLDGTVNVSSIVQVNYNQGTEQTEFSLYPSLADTWVNIQGIERGKEVRYEIRTPLGYLVKRGKIGDTDQTLDISGLSSGMLYLTLTDGSRFKTLAFRKI